MQESSGGAVIYSARVGREIYTRRHYDTMLALLKAIGAVEVAGSYRVGEYPKSYRLGEAYQDCIGRLEIHAPRLEKRLAKATDCKAPQTTVRKWLEHVYLERSSFAPTVAAVLAHHPYRTDQQRICYQYHHDRFADKARLYEVAESGRVTYVPNLIPKVLRREILIDGEPIVEIDVAASQPRLALTLFPKDSPETRRFVSLLDSGDLYEIAANWIDEWWPPDRAKQEFFKQVLYGSKRHHHHFPMWIAFSARFRELATIIEREKRDDLRVFPVKLQTIEAQIMIEGVAAECAAKRVPILAIHDGFATKLADADRVAEMVARHWQAKTGHAPRIRVAGEFRKAS